MTGLDQSVWSQPVTTDWTETSLRLQTPSERLGQAEISIESQKKLILKYSQSSKLEQIDLCLHNVKTMKYFKENTKQRNVDKFF